MPHGNKGKKQTREHIIKRMEGAKKSWFKKGQHPSHKTEFKKGDISAYWKGGRRKNNIGYIQIWSPNHPFNSYGYVMEHRLIMEKHIQRFLQPQEVVHHINGIKDDNHIENLKLFLNNSLHIKFHHN